jgi:hypothetical protein
MSAPTATITITDTLVGGNDLPTVTFTFDQPVFNFGLEDVFSPSGFFTLFDSVSSSQFTARYNPFPNTDDDNSFIRVNLTGLTDRSDPAIAGVGVSDSATFSVDTVRPTITSFTISDAVLRPGETATVTLVFSEAVTLPIGNLSAQEAVYSNLATLDGGITYTATLTPNANSQSNSIIALHLNGATDAAGNSTGAAQPGPNLNLNTIRPTVTITIDDDTVQAGQTATVTFTFSEAVNGFDFSDISSFGIGGSLGSPNPTGLTTYTASFTPFTDFTDLTNTFSVDMTGVASATSGNTGVGLTQSPNIAVDTQRPTVAVAVADPNLAAGQTSLVTFTFSEAVTGFTTADATVENGALSGLASGDGGVTWTGTLTPTAAVNDATNVLTVDRTGVTDGFGNTGTGAATSANYVLDATAPTATVVLADSALSVGETSQVTITFSEAVTGFTSADLAAPNGSLSGVVTSDGGTTWTAIYTPSANVTDATNIVTLAATGVTDVAGNPGVGTPSSANFTIDTARPAVAIAIADRFLAVGQTTLVTFTFSEPVTGFANADIQIPNGALSAVTSGDGGVTWTATFTPTPALDDATNTFIVDLSGVTDATANTGSGATGSLNFTIDSTPPTAIVVISDNDFTGSEQATVSITFSERAGPFSATAANGSLSAFSTGDGVTYTAVFTPFAGVSDTTNVVTLVSGTDEAGNALVGPVQSNNYAMNTPPDEPPPPPPPPPAPVAPTGTAAADTIAGTAQADTVSGGDGTDSIAGGEGADTISGDAGDDQLQGNVGLDTIMGGAGNDVLHGGQDADLVQGGQDNDLVFGDRGTDTVLGGQGDDQVFGGDGDDFLSGDRGSDTLTGGAGADIFHSFGGAGLDRVTDFNFAEGDRVRLDAGTTFTTAQVGGDTVVSMSGGGQLVLADVQLSSLQDGWIVAG